MRTCAKCGVQEGALRKQHTRGLRVVLLSEVAGELLCGPCTLGKIEQEQGGINAYAPGYSGSGPFEFKCSTCGVRWETAAAAEACRHPISRPPG